MNKDWERLLQLIDTTEDNEDELETLERKNFPDFENMSPDELMDHVAYERSREMELLKAYARNYTLENLRKMMLLFFCFNQMDKALIIGEEAFRRFPDEQDLLIYTVRAATKSDRLRGQHAFVRLIYGIPRDELTAEGYQAAVRYLLCTARNDPYDEELARELLEDYRSHHSDDPAWDLLKSEMESNLKKGDSVHHAEERRKEGSE